MARFGDVVLVPFPFSDQAGLKKRPAVVISGHEYNAQGIDFIILAITSRLREPPKLGEMVIRDWQEAGLIKPSALKPVFATIEQRLVIRVMGSLTPIDLAGLRRVIADVIG